MIPFAVSLPYFLSIRVNYIMWSRKCKPEQMGKIVKIADGVIVGSAIVKIIEQYGSEAGSHIYEYVMKMKAAVLEPYNDRLEGE
jgi:hypothetical protein